MSIQSEFVFLRIRLNVFCLHISLISALTLISASMVLSPIDLNVTDVFCGFLFPSIICLFDLRIVLRTAGNFGEDGGHKSCLFARESLGS